MDGLVEGRIVHFVMPNGEHTPAIVLKVWDHDGNTGTANLMVFTDGSNALPETKEQEELYKLYHGMNLDEIRHGHIWQTSKTFSEVPQPGTWHWPEKA
jgi:hypothetical protein